MRRLKAKLKETEELLAKTEISGKNTEKDKDQLQNEFKIMSKKFEIEKDRVEKLLAEKNKKEGSDSGLML